MEFAFDPDKDRLNRMKHGVWVDGRFEYGEMRLIALALETNTLYYVAFVDRGEQRRIISLRPATRREVKHYVEHFG